MTNDLIPAELRKDVDEINSCENASQLNGMLNGFLLAGTKTIILVATIIRRLDELGEPVTVELSTVNLLRRVAYGQVHPELVAKLQGNSFLLERSSHLPILQQLAIANNEPIKVLELDGDHRMVPPLSLTQNMIYQVFGRSGFRNDSEQICWLRDRREAKKIREVEFENPITIDRKRKGIVCGGIFVPAAELARCVAELTK